MARLVTVLSLCLLTGGCGRPLPLPLPAAVMAPVPVRVSAVSVRGSIRGTIMRYLAKAHPTMVIDEKAFTVTEAVVGGKRAFTAIVVSPRQRRRLAGHYDVTTQTAAVETDVPAP